MVDKQLNWAAMGWSGRKLEAVMTSKIPDLPELLNVAPYSSHTLELLMAYQDAVEQVELEEVKQIQATSGSQIARTYNTPFDNIEMLKGIPDVQSLRRDLSLDNSVSKTNAIYMQRWKLFVELVKQPDYCEDITYYPQSSKKMRLASEILADYNWVLLYFWEKAKTDAYGSAFEIINLDRCVTAANAHTASYYKHKLDWKYNAIAKFARSTQNSTSASLLLAELEKLAPKEDTSTDETKVRNFLLMDCLAILRECRKAGIKLQIENDASPLDLYWDCIDLSGGDGPGTRVVNYALLDLNSSGDSIVLKFFARHSQLVRELFFIGDNSWEFGHLFPVGYSTATMLDAKQPPFDLERANFDLARLNIAAYLYFIKNGKWPSTPADLVPQWFHEEPVCPAQMGGYIWSQRFQEFRVKKEPVKYGII
jgi:hypothetical protein